MIDERWVPTPATPEALFAVGAISQYLGAAIAVSLFDEIDAPGVALLRVLGAAAVLLAIRRPWRRAWTRAEAGLAALFGCALAVMNLAFYLAIDELPLGNAVAIEFLGPLLVAAFGSRNRNAAFSLLMAVAGVALLADVESDGSTRGFVFALLAGAAWAGYIVLGHRVARSGIAVDGLGVAMVVGALLISVVGVGDLGPALGTPHLLALGLATGLLSNAIPYAIDQFVLQQLDRTRFALLQALLPVTAVLVGLVALHQTPSVVEIAAIGLVVMALAIPPSPAR